MFDAILAGGGSSAENLDLVEQLTGYVSDALAEVLISLERARHAEL